MSEVTPRVYVACLAAYNNGKLHGKWIDCTLGTDHLWSGIKDVLATSPETTPHLPCEEWAIHDYEGFPDGSVHESSGVEQVCELAETIEGDDGEAIVELKSHLGIDSLAEAKTYHEDNYCGVWDSFQDYAEDYVDSTGMLGEACELAQRYFDYESFARDLAYDYLTIDIDGELHIWHNT